MKIKISNFFKNRMHISIILFVCLFIFSILLDQLTKGLLIKNVIPNVGDSIKVIPEVISFIYVKNMGAAWGIFSNSLVFLIIMTFIGMGVIMTFYIIRLRKVGKNSSLFLGVCVGLMMGGAIGNLIDRLFLGFVRDFINFDFMTFPVFNFADVSLTIGIFLTIIYILFFYSKESEKALNSSKNNKNLVKNEEKTVKIDENNEFIEIDNENKNENFSQKNEEQDE